MDITGISGRLPMTDDRDAALAGLREFAARDGGG